MPDNAFRSVVVRTGPWLLQCSGQHPTRHGTPRRWRSVHFSSFACRAHDARLGHTQGWHPGDHPHAVAYDMADPVTDGCARAAYTSAACSAQCRGHKLACHCVHSFAVYRHPAAAFGISSYLRSHGCSYAAHYTVGYRDRYLTKYLPRYLARNCVRRQGICLGRWSGSSVRDDTAPCSGSSTAPNRRPDPAPGNPTDGSQRSALDAAHNWVQCGTASSDANLWSKRAAQGGPHCASSCSGYALARTTAHSDSKAGQYIWASKRPGATGYCDDRPGTSPAPG
jgi:hypothetical protein